jgi:inorganic pyrophosphatase
VTASGDRYRAHPWHGVAIGKGAPGCVTVYVEIVPTDTVKYEIDKVSGFLRIDRPQKYSNVCPTLYGFIPQTFCGNKVGEFCAQKTGRSGILGDGDPMDVCVLSEKVISHADILLQAIPIGGLRMIDGNQADDKIVAVLQGDGVFGLLHEISECPGPLIDRLRHYFLTYKLGPDRAAQTVEVTHVYGRDEAHEVIRRSQQDYGVVFGP